QVIGIFLKYGFEDLVSYLDEKKRFGFIKKLIPGDTYNKALHLTKWEKMRLVCEELGPTFVKFGQILSNRPDLLPADLIKELEKLQDGVPPIPGDIAREVLEKELGKKTGDLFATFEKEAFASASMAQVHKGTLKNGDRIVVKIQRPGIQEVIQSDIKVMYYLADVFSKRIPSLRSFDPVGLVKNFEASIIKELDFIHESVNIQRFHNNFLKDETNEGYIHSPKVYSEFTTGKVLTMEYIEGIKISDSKRLNENGCDGKVIAHRLALSYFKQIFTYGFFHADPHPGNLLVLPGNVICYLDYGMMGSIVRKDLEALANLFMAVKSKDVRLIIRGLQQLSDNTIIRNYRDLESDVDEFVQNYGFRDLHQNEMSTIMLQLKDIVIKHGLKVPTHFFLLIRSMVTIEGVLRQLDPELDLTKMMRPFLVKMVAKHYNPVQFVKRAVNSVYELGMYMEEFPRDLKNAMRKINTGEIKVDLRHKGIDPLVHTINRVSKQIVSSVLIAALIIGSSQMVIHHVHPLWGQSSALGVVGFILAGFIGISMLRDVRRGDHDGWPGWRDLN
ncbi:MAG: ABC1 kinase family protein, partial [Bacteroidia bacterium]